jgi:RecA/RadA recombinase
VSGASNLLALDPAGPVAGAFVRSTAIIDAIMGPVGSGKTTACIQKCVMAALRQAPAPDGHRYCRIAVVRDTYPALDSTTIASWHTWFPKEVGKWVGDSPRTHELTFRLSDDALVHLEMIFIAIGDKRVEDVLRGLEVTIFWLNEADRLHRDVLKYALGRIGRYPSTRLGGCAYAAIIMDFNAPDTDSWTYELLVDRAFELPPSLSYDAIKFWRQPGGREPGAENLHNLPEGRSYYDVQMIGASQDYIRRMIDNQFGAVRNGTPVYPEFSDAIHVAAHDLQPVRGLPLLIGADAGLTPAAVFGQRLATGRIIRLDEIAILPGADGEVTAAGPTRFADMILQVLRERFDGLEVQGVCDPSADTGSDGSGHEPTWMQIVARQTRVPFRPARTNDLTVRLEAVRGPLKRLIDGQPGSLVSPRCRVLRRAYNSGYVYQRVQLACGGGRYENKPQKNHYSHIADADQYLHLACGEGRTALAGGRPVGGGVRVIDDYHPFGDSA